MAHWKGGGTSITMVPYLVESNLNTTSHRVKSEKMAFFQLSVSPAGTAVSRSYGVRWTATVTTYPLMK